MRKARSFDQLAAAGATPTTGYELPPVCKLRRTHSATFRREPLCHLEHSPDYGSTEGDSSPMESNLQTKKALVCRLCASKMDVLHDYEGGSSIISSILKGRVCEWCRDLAEYTPGYGSSKEPLLTKEEHESITEQLVMGLHRKQLCRILPEIKLKGKKLEEQDSTGEKPSSGNLNSKDEDEFDSDDSFEEIYIPTVQGWFKLLTSNQLETNGDEAILALVAQVKELEMSQPSFHIYTNGFYSKEDRSSRQGAVLRDFHNRPIAAWSRIDSDVESISRLHNELEGLSLVRRNLAPAENVPCLSCGTKRKLFNFCYRYILLSSNSISYLTISVLLMEKTIKLHTGWRSSEKTGKWTCRKLRSTRVYRRFSTQMYLGALIFDCSIKLYSAKFQIASKFFWCSYAELGA